MRTRAFGILLGLVALLGTSACSDDPTLAGQYGANVQAVKNLLDDIGDAGGPDFSFIPEDVFDFLSSLGFGGVTEGSGASRGPIDLGDEGWSFGGVFAEIADGEGYFRGVVLMGFRFTEGALEVIIIVDNYEDEDDILYIDDLFAADLTGHVHLGGFESDYDTAPQAPNEDDVIQDNCGYLTENPGDNPTADPARGLWSTENAFSFGSSFDGGYTLSIYDIPLDPMWGFYYFVGGCES